MLPKNALLASLGALTAVALTACGGESVETTAAAQESATNTVEHFRGTTEVPADPQRVVVLDLGELDSAVALGVTPVGAVKAPVDTGLLSYLQPQLEDVQLVGEIGEPNLEAIAALDPDLILGSDVRVKDFYDELSAIAPTVFSETVGVAWKENFQLHAQALGREEEAEELLSEYEARAEEVGAKIPDDTEVSIVRFVPGEIRLYAQDNFIGTVLKDAGVARPAAQDVASFDVVVSPEQIDQAAGDEIFVGTYGDPAETDGPTVLGGPLWKRIAAVQSGDVHTVDDDIWFLGTGVGAAGLVLDELEQTLAG